MSWAAEELKTANLGDKRRNQRLIKIVEDLSAMPIASVTQAARDKAAVQGIYEFWGNVRVQAHEILAAHRDSTLSRVEGQEIAISWLLLTTLEVRDFEQASRCLRWYSYRWLIERYHYTLKSGCRLEQLQLETADRLERALATYAIVAWRLLWLTYEARTHPSESIEGILPAHYWIALYCHIHQTTVLPQEPPSLADCVRWIARLGGFLGRKSDGEPGVKTLWLGLQRVHDMASIWQLLAPGN